MTNMNQQAQAAQRLTDHYFDLFEAATDPDERAILFGKAVYWLIEVDIELATEAAFRERLGDRA